MQPGIELQSLHVISDLHLGGGSGFQIFGSTAELQWLIDRVTALPQPGPHALLINGDFVDFLAEEPSLAFDPDGATAKLDDIWKRFENIFVAMRRLLATPERLLIVNLGNHDLELALPWVRAHLARKLTEGDAAAHARLLIVTDGTGVRCRVGGATVVCMHGNEVDSWNVVDYERLRRIGRDRQFGLMPEAWIPNAGSQLVIEVMNAIKRDYPFVDLLKPETEGVLPLLAALDTGVHRKLLDLAAVAGRKAWDIARMRTGFLDDGDSGTTGPDGYRPAIVLNGMDPRRSSQALLNDVESAWRRAVDPIALVRGMQAQQLGFWSATRDFFSGKPRQEVLREAMEYLDRDRSFDPSAPDSTFRDLDAMVGADVDLLLAGHTHLERSLARSRGRGHYFNSGTWARLIRIEPDLRRDEAAFEALFRLLDRATMPMLDIAKAAPAGAAPRDLVLRLNTVVVVEKSAAGPTRASLQHVEPAKNGAPIDLKPASAAAMWTGG